jgi:hypothetical protein
MGLAQIQELMAHVYTDDAVRERFFADPQEVARRFGLTGDEFRQLQGVSERRVRFFAASLERKRLTAVRKLLPLTNLAIGPQFADLFRRHAASYSPRGHKRHRDDALAMAALIEQVALEGQLAPAPVAELVRYEAAKIKASDPMRLFTACWLGRPNGELAPSSGLASDAAVNRLCPAVVVWFRCWPNGRLRRVVLPLPRLWSRSSPRRSRDGHHGLSRRIKSVSRDVQLLRPDVDLTRVLHH